jgi:hypothetical protein
LKIAGIDVATNSGLAICDGDVFRAESFRPSAKRPFDLDRGEVDFQHEGKMVREFRDHLRAWLVANEIEAVAMERPLQSNVSFKKPVVDMAANFAGQAIKYEQKGGTTFNVIFRLYALAGAACETCERLNIPLYVVNNKTWRSSFFGAKSPPKGCDNASKWWKQQSMLQCHRLGIDVRNGDQADAIGLAWHLRGHLNPRIAGAAEDLFRPKVAT